MVMSDKDIFALIVSKDLEIAPLCRNNVQPASVDLTLCKTISVPQKDAAIDVQQASKEQVAELFTSVDITNGFTLAPGDWVLASTVELLGIPSTCNAHIFNRNSLAQIGLDVLASGYINPGYRGHMTLVLKNLGSFMITIHPNIRICQLEIRRLATPAIRSYEERHNGQAFNKDAIVEAFVHEGMDKLEQTKPIDTGLSEFLQQRIKSLVWQ